MVEAELANIGPIDPKPLMVAEEVQRETPPPLTASNGHNGSGEFNYWRIDDLRIRYLALAARRVDVSFC
jgi:hypothetical protein